MFSWKKVSLISSLIIIAQSCQTFTSWSQKPTERTVAQAEVLQKEVELPAVSFQKRLVDYKPYNYEVLFTDPVCGPYNYTTQVLSQSGEVLKNKPANVYCKNKYDLRRSGERPQSPQYRLIEWIKQDTTQEIFFTYLSFRNKAVKNALCEVAKKGVKIRFVMSSTEDQTVAQELVACSPANVEMKTRGMENGLGYAHNKFFIVNPNSKKEFKIVFSSGNMTSGPVIHHENWNFITTHPVSHFAQAHLCAMNAEWDEEAGRSRAAYIQAIKACRQKIKAPEESDIKVFFVPGEGEPDVGITKKTASEFMLQGHEGFPGIQNAQRIWLGCHRFFYSKMVNALSKRMLSAKKPDLRIVADDDTFYKAKDPNYTIGDTMPEEYYRIEQLVSKGAQARFMETNGDEHQLHHSKYLIFADKKTKNATQDFTAVFTGSANLTGAGFNKNWENSYYIMIPEVAQKFAEHYQYTWDKLATQVKDLPQSGMVAPQLMEEPDLKTENNGVQK